MPLKHLNSINRTLLEEKESFKLFDSNELSDENTIFVECETEDIAKFVSPSVVIDKENNTTNLRVIIGDISVHLEHLINSDFRISDYTTEETVEDYRNCRHCGYINVEGLGNQMVKLEFGELKILLCKDCISQIDNICKKIEKSEEVEKRLMSRSF